MVCWDRPFHFNFFKGCLPQILLDLFLNTLPQILYSSNLSVSNKFLVSFTHKTLKSSETSKPLWRLHSGRWTVTHPPSENKGLRDIVHNMRIVLDTKRSIFGSQHWLWFNIWFIMILYYKMRQIFKNLTAILL